MPFGWKWIFFGFFSHWSEFYSIKIVIVQRYLSFDRKTFYSMFAASTINTIYFSNKKSLNASRWSTGNFHRLNLQAFSYSIEKSFETKIWNRLHCTAAVVEVVAAMDGGYFYSSHLFFAHSKMIMRNIANDYIVPIENNKTIIIHESWII